MTRDDLVLLEDRFTVETTTSPTYGEIFVVTCKTCGRCWKFRTTTKPEKATHPTEHICRGIA